MDTTQDRHANAAFYWIATFLCLALDFTLLTYVLGLPPDATSLFLLPGIYLNHILNIQIVALTLPISLAATAFCFVCYNRNRTPGKSIWRKLDRYVLVGGLGIISFLTSLLLYIQLTAPISLPKYLDSLSHNGRVYHLEATQSSETRSRVQYLVYVCDSSGFMCRGAFVAGIAFLNAPDISSRSELQDTKVVLRYNSDTGKVEYGVSGLHNGQSEFYRVGFILS